MELLQIVHRFVELGHISAKEAHALQRYINAGRIKSAYVLEKFLLKIASENLQGGHGYRIVSYASGIPYGSGMVVRHTDIYS